MAAIKWSRRNIVTGGTVCLRYTGAAPVRREDDGRWATVIKRGQTRVTVLLDGREMSVHADNISDARLGTGAP